jgi:hypothetical protein
MSGGRRGYRGGREAEPRGKETTSAFGRPGSHGPIPRELLLAQALRSG